MADYGDELTRAVAAELRDLRVSQGLSMDTLAKRAELHRSTIHLVEQGKRGLTVAAAARLARPLGESLGVVIVRAESKLAERC